jgi:surfactin synthase thioesterase subunit
MKRMVTTTQSGSRWILSHSERSGTAPRLFCLPFAGRGASMYVPWGGALRDAFDVVAIQLPGRENRLREPPLTTIPALATEIVGAVSDLLDRPCAWFGHSMGALVAFEVARELRRQRLPSPRLLFVSAKPAPQLGPGPRPMGRLPDAALLERLHDDFGLDLSDDMRPLIELMLPTIRADICAVDDYRFVPEERFPFPIVALGGDRDLSVSPAELHAWAAHTASTFRTHLLPGGHFFIDGCRDELTALLRREYAALQ